MVSLEQIHETRRSIDEASSGPRISFSSDFLDDKNYISIIPKEHAVVEKERSRNADFEFLSSNNSLNSSSQTTMLSSADELFCEGKLLPFWQTQNAEKFNKINLEKTEKHELLEPKNNNNNANKDDCKRGWFLDDDPSPRPPTCTVLWKELFKLRKQRPSSTLSPSSSSSSSSSSSLRSFGDVVVAKDERKEGSSQGSSREKHGKRLKKGLERTRSATIRVKPLINVQICTHGKNTSALPPLASLKKGRLQSK